MHSITDILMRKSSDDTKLYDIIFVIICYKKIYIEKNAE